MKQCVVEGAGALVKPEGLFQAFEACTLSVLQFQVSAAFTDETLSVCSSKAQIHLATLSSERLVVQGCEGGDGIGPSDGFPASDAGGTNGLTHPVVFIYRRGGSCRVAVVTYKGGFGGVAVVTTGTSSPAFAEGRRFDSY
jgi:hypothetical protein